jgi:hypothetical protein
MPSKIPLPPVPKHERVWKTYQHTETEEDKKKKLVWQQVEQEWKELKDNGKHTEAEAFKTRLFERVKELMETM